MTRLFAVAMIMVAATAPAFACEWNNPPRQAHNRLWRRNPARSRASRCSTAAHNSTTRSGYLPSEAGLTRPGPAGRETIFERGYWLE